MPPRTLVELDGEAPLHCVKKLDIHAIFKVHVQFFICVFLTIGPWENALVAGPVTAPLSNFPPKIAVTFGLIIQF